MPGKDIQAGSLEMTLVIGHPVQTVSVVERSGTGQLETTLDLLLYKSGGTFEAAIRVFLVDSHVVTLRILAAFQHRRHNRDQLGV